MQARYAVLGVVLVLAVITGVLIYQGNHPSTPAGPGATTTTATQTTSTTSGGDTGNTSAHKTSKKPATTGKTTHKTLSTNATPSHITSSPGYHQSRPPQSSHAATAKETAATG